MAPSQTGACLHTMAIMQTYQVDLLRDLDEGEVVGSGGSADAIKKLRRATDLSLRATKETAHAIGPSMAALVGTERHLWLNLSDIKEKDKAFLLVAPLSPPGLFGNAVNLVVKRFQEAKRQSAEKFIPALAVNIKLLAPAAAEGKCCISSPLLGPWKLMCVGLLRGGKPISYWCVLGHPKRDRQPLNKQSVSGLWRQFLQSTL